MGPHEFYRLKNKNMRGSIHNLRYITATYYHSSFIKWDSTCVLKQTLQKTILFMGVVLL